MDLHIVTLGGEGAVVNLDLTEKVSVLKCRISEQEGTPALIQKLVWQDQVLDDSRSLAEQGVDGVDPLVLLRSDWATLEDEAASALVERIGACHCLQHHFFWAVHEGNWLAVRSLARRAEVDVNAEMQPPDFEDAIKDYAWPYCRFDGRYEDRALHLASRCKDACTVAALLRSGANVKLKNDNGETALDLALGKGEKDSHAFLEPRDFGGDPELIVSLLDGSGDAGRADLLVKPPEAPEKKVLPTTRSLRGRIGFSRSQRGYLRGDLN